MTQTAKTFHVDCPSCYTSFPVDPAKVPDGGVLARCSACEGVFRVQKPEDDFTAHLTPEAPAREQVGTVSSPSDEAAGEVGHEAWGTETTVEDSAGPMAEEPLVAEEATADWTEERATSQETTTDWTEEHATSDEATADWTEARATSQEAAADWTDERATSDEAAADWSEERVDFEDTTVDLSEEPESLAGVTDDFSDDLGATAAPLTDVAETFGDTAEPAMEPPLAWDDTTDTAVEAPHLAEDTADAGVEEGAPFADRETEAPPVATDMAPAVAHPAPPVFGKRDPKEKAQRLARVLVSDMITYNKDRHVQALAEGTLVEDFEDEIKKSWAEYVDQVGEEIAEGTPFFTDALNEILARGESVF